MTRIWARPTRRRGPRSGSFEQSTLAGLVVLSGGVFSIDAGGIVSVEVKLTVFDGRIVYRQPSIY